MAFSRRNRGLLVDLDGTVRQTKSGRPHPVKAWDQVIRPGVAERLMAFKKRRYKIVGITNQGGVAYGYLTEIDVEQIHQQLQEELLPGIFDLIFYCPYHPKGRVPQYRVDSDDRKPKPGMAFKARDALGLDLSKSIMVGDLDTDREFATNAGIPHYFHESEFFGPTPHPRVLQLLQDATQEVVEKKGPSTKPKVTKSPGRPELRKARAGRRPAAKAAKAAKALKPKRTKAVASKQKAASRSSSKTPARVRSKRSSANAASPKRAKATAAKRAASAPKPRPKSRAPAKRSAWQRLLGR